MCWDLAKFCTTEISFIIPYYIYYTHGACARMYRETIAAIEIGLARWALSVCAYINRNISMWKYAAEWNRAWIDSRIFITVQLRPYYGDFRPNETTGPGRRWLIFRYTSVIRQIKTCISRANWHTLLRVRGPDVSNQRWLNEYITMIKYIYIYVHIYVHIYSSWCSVKSVCHRCARFAMFHCLELSLSRCLAQSKINGEQQNFQLWTITNYSF